MKGRTDDKKFRQLAERVTDHVISLSGDKALSAYTIHDAKAFRDALKARGAAPTTIKRNFAVVVKRLPIPIEDIHRVQMLCFDLDDDIRWIIAAVSDSGMRLTGSTPEP